MYLEPQTRADLPLCITCTSYLNTALNRDISRHGYRRLERYRIIADIEGQLHACVP